MRPLYRFAILVLIVFAPAVKAGIPSEQIPSPLQPWVNWDLYGMEDSHYPVLYNQVSW
jgi:hypothetical protein